MKERNLLKSAWSYIRSVLFILMAFISLFSGMAIAMFGVVACYRYFGYCEIPDFSLLIASTVIFIVSSFFTGILFVSLEMEERKCR